MGVVYSKLGQMWQNIMAGAFGSNVESTPQIFKLNVDSFKDWFEWLSQEDLEELRLTCKRMKRVVDNYIKLNYPTALQKIYLNENRLSLGFDASGFELLKHLIIYDEVLITSRTDNIKGALNRLEILEIFCQLPECDFHENILKHCTQLKQLMINSWRGDFTTKLGNGWLHQNYPTLEHIGVTNVDETCMELENFFQQNPNVRTFTTSFKFIWNNRDWLLASNIKIDRLDITDEDFNWGFEMLGVRAVLAKIHGRGFYQRLYLYIHLCPHELLPDLALLPAIEHLSLMRRNWFELSAMVNMKSLYISSDWEVRMNSLMNVHTISLGLATFDKIESLIQRCPKLEQIKIGSLLPYPGSERYFVDGIIDLPALNNERKKLENAQKITIFIEEDIFLENKWKQSIDLSLIKLERDQTWEPFNPFFSYI